MVFALIIEMRSQTRTARDVRLVTAHSVVEAVEFRLNTALPHQQPLSSTTLAAYDKGVSGMVHGTAGLYITSAYEVRACQQTLIKTVSHIHIYYTMLFVWRCYICCAHLFVITW